MKRMYVVLAMSSKMNILVDDNPQSHPLEIKWSDGMIGALPCFSSKKAAKRYAGKREIITLEEIPPTQEPKP